MTTQPPARRRWLPVARAAGLLAVLLTAPPGPASAGRIEERDGRTVIVIETAVPVDPSSPSAGNQADLAAIRAFKQDFPRLFAERYRDRYRADPARYGRHNWDRVELEVEPFTGLKVEGAEVDLLAIAGGIAPDVLYINFRKSDNYIRNGFLHPLDREEDGFLGTMSEQDLAFRVHPKLWPVIDRPGPGGRHVWALPYGGALGRVLLFRKDLFEAAGVPHPTVAWTWDDLLDAARRIADPARGIYALQLSHGKHESWYWVTYLWSAGGEVMTYDEAADRWRCVFGSRAGAQALDFYTRLATERWTDRNGRVQRGYANRDERDALTKWERGETAMLMSYVDERVFSTINPEVVGMIPVPIGPGGLRAGELNSRMMGLYSGIREPAVRDAAWEYIRFYESEAAVQIKTRVLVESGFGPFVNPRYLRQFGYPEFEHLSPPGWAETFEIAVGTGRPEPYGRNSNVAYDLMTKPLEQAAQLALAERLPEDPEARLAALEEILKKAEARANEIMIGVIPPEERRLRRAVAWIVLASLAAGFALMVRRVAQTFRPAALAGAAAPAAWDFRRHAWAYALLLPAALTILTWQYLPLLQGAGMAFFDYRLIGASTWAGVDNFGDVLFDGFWWNTIWNAFRYSLLVIALTFLPPVVLAILLQEVPRGGLLLRLVYYLPAVISGLVTILLWKQFYEPSERGVLNALMMRVPAAGFLLAGAGLLALALAFARRLWLNDMRGAAGAFAFAGAVLFVTVAGIARPLLLPDGLSPGALARLPALLFARLPEPTRWLGDPDTAMLACVIPLAWAGMGPGCLIYLAALKGIPDDYYEAADIDGASFLDKILFIIFPMLKPLLIINFVGAFINAWYHAGANILVMTGGGANTEVAGLHIWYKAFTFLQFGPATAMAWLLGFLLIGFTVYQLRILARVEFRTASKKD